jgi:hypothetical protein
MKNQVSILVRNGQFKNLVRDILLSHGLELVDEVATHGGREVCFRIPAHVSAPKVENAL